MNRWIPFVLLLLASGLWATNLPVKRYALFVGANQGGSGTQPLLYAQKDALKMEQVMQEVGGVKTADRLVLLDPTPEAVRSALGTLAAQMEAVPQSENRRTEFLFYYSGHSDENGLLLGTKSFSYKALRDGLQAVPADVRIAILDSCSSGAFARLKGGVQHAPFLEQDASQMRGHAFLTSSSDKEASQESDTLEGSFFTHYLVSGLRGGADMAGDGLITLNEAYQYAFQNTLARTESTQAGPQHPSYEIQLSGTGDLILSDVQDSSTRLKLAADVSGKLYVRNLDGLLFAEVTKDSGAPLFLALQAGNYTVTAVTPQKSRVSKVTMAPRGITTLSSQDFQEQDLGRFAVRGGTMVQPTSDADRLVLDFATFSLGAVPGASREDWDGTDKTVALGILVDSSRSVRGVQATGIMSLNRQTLEGVQASGVGSLSHGEVRGVQAAFVFNITGSGFHGVQYGGVFNMALGERSDNVGVQSAGVFNLSQGVFRGVQGAGTINIANAVDGIQAAPVNIAGDVRGVQLGIINVNTRFEGVGIGLINISPDAYYHPTALFDSYGNAHYLFQWGMGWLYFVVGAIVTDPFASSPVGRPLGGAGVKLRNDDWFWDTDAGWTGSLTNGGTSRSNPKSSEINPNGHAYIRSTVGLSMGWLAPEIGVIIDPTAGNVQPDGYLGVRVFP